MNHFVFFISRFLLRLQKWFSYGKIKEILLFVLSTKWTLSNAMQPDVGFIKRPKHITVRILGLSF